MRECLSGWIRNGLPFQPGEDGQPRFNPVEVINWIVDQGMQGRDPFWKERYIGTERSQVQQLHGVQGDSVPALSPVQARRFRFRLERNYKLNQPAGERVRLRIPKPIDGPGQKICDLQVDDFPDWQHQESDGRVEWRVPQGWHGEICLGLVATVECMPDAQLSYPLDTRERAMLTRLDEGWIEGLPEVMALADSLDLVDDTPLAVAKAAYTAVGRSVRLGAVHYADLPLRGALRTVLQEGWADCQMAAALFCALCRAHGIPARLVSGYPLYEGRRSHHFWAQAWIEDQGWRHWDFVSWQMAQAGQDLQWRDLFNGHQEWRLVLQIFPRLFTGPGSVPFPAQWHMLHQTCENGSSTQYVSCTNGQLIYAERLSLLS